MLSVNFSIWKAECLDAMSGAAAAIILHRDTAIREGPDDLKATGFNLRCLNRGNHFLYHISKQCVTCSLRAAKPGWVKERRKKIWCPSR